MWFHAVLTFCTGDQLCTSLHNDTATHFDIPCGPQQMCTHTHTPEPYAVITMAWSRPPCVAVPLSVKLFVVILLVCLTGEVKG